MNNKLKVFATTILASAMINASAVEKVTNQELMKSMNSKPKIENYEGADKILSKSYDENHSNELSEPEKLDGGPDSTIEQMKAITTSVEEAKTTFLNSEKSVEDFRMLNKYYANLAKKFSDIVALINERGGASKEEIEAYKKLKKLLDDFGKFITDGLKIKLEKNKQELEKNKQELEKDKQELEKNKQELEKFKKQEKEKFKKQEKEKDKQELEKFKQKIIDYFVKKYGEEKGRKMAEKEIMEIEKGLEEIKK